MTISHARKSNLIRTNFNWTRIFYFFSYSFEPSYRKWKENQELKNRDHHNLKILLFEKGQKNVFREMFGLKANLE